MKIGGRAGRFYRIEYKNSIYFWEECEVGKDYKCIITGKKITKGKKALRPFNKEDNNRDKRIFMDAINLQ